MFTFCFVITLITFTCLVVAVPVFAMPPFAHIAVIVPLFTCGGIIQTILQPAHMGSTRKGRRRFLGPQGRDLGSPMRGRQERRDR